MRASSSFVGVCLAAAVTMPRAQVFVVDAAGGSGSHFTDLPTAVAAVPDGATLRVRPGLYAGFVLDGKGLSIVAEGAVQVIPGPTVVVRRTTANQPVLLKGLEFAKPWFFDLSPLALEVSNAAGPVVVEDCLVPYETSYGISFRILSCVNVWLHRCDLAPALEPSYPSSEPRLRIVDSTVQISHSRIDGLDGHFPSGYLSTCYPARGTQALYALRSRVFVVRSTFAGGTGSAGRDYQGLWRCITNPGDGGSGVGADASTLIALGTTITGADGHDEYMGTVFIPASNGLVAGNGTRATMMNFTLAGGRGGATTGRPGLPLRLDATSSFAGQAAARPTNGRIDGMQARGQSVAFVAEGAPVSPLVLLLSYRADLVPVEPLALGSRLALPAAALGAFVIPASGTFRAPFVIPGNWPVGETFFAQFVSLEPGRNVVWVSNAFPLHVNH